MKKVNNSRKHAEEPRQDRRVKYTKAALREALVTLLAEQHISKITVKALCDTADVNRSTFYAHYENQYDLLEQVEREVMVNLVAYLGSWQENSVPISTQNLRGILEYARQSTRLFAALLGENCGPGFQTKLSELVLLAPYAHNTDARKKAYLSTYGYNGCISVLHLWLSGGAKEPTDEMAEFLMDVLSHGFSPYW